MKAMLNILNIKYFKSLKSVSGLKVARIVYRFQYFNSSFTIDAILASIR